MENSDEVEPSNLLKVLIRVPSSDQLCKQVGILGHILQTHWHPVRDIDGMRSKPSIHLGRCLQILLLWLKLKESYQMCSHFYAIKVAPKANVVYASHSTNMVNVV